jgi:hypothetical protein
MLQDATHLAYTPLIQAADDNNLPKVSALVTYGEGLLLNETDNWVGNGHTTGLLRISPVVYFESFCSHNVFTCFVFHAPM